jgi:hypothetical protein
LLKAQEIDPSPSHEMVINSCVYDNILSYELIYGFAISALSLIVLISVIFFLKIKIINWKTILKNLIMFSLFSSAIFLFFDNYSYIYYDQEFKLKKLAHLIWQPYTSPVNLFLEHEPLKASLFVLMILVFYSYLFSIFHRYNFYKSFLITVIPIFFFILAFYLFYSRTFLPLDGIFYRFFC